MDKPIYDFKKGDIDYDDKRKQYLIYFYQYKYHNKEEFKNRIKKILKIDIKNLKKHIYNVYTKTY